MKITDCFTDKLLNHNNYSSNEIVLLKHGMDIFIHDGGELLCVFALSLLLHNTNSTLIYVTSFSALRLCTGGYHASTRMLCTLQYIAMYLYYYFLLQIKFSFILQLSCLIISALYILHNAPIEHRLNCLTKEERKYNQICCRIILLILVLSYLVLLALRDDKRTTIVIVLLFNALMMILLKHSKNWRGNMNDNRYNN